MNEKLKDWFRSDDTGLSSQAIVAKLEGMTLPDVLRWGYCHPLDPADLGRCLRLLNKFPEYRERLHEMAECSPQWENLVEHWRELERLYYLGLSRDDNRAPECYELMKKLVDKLDWK